MGSGQCLRIKIVNWSLMQLLRGRTRTEAVNRWTAKEACFYSAAVVRGSIEVGYQAIDGLRWGRRGHRTQEPHSEDGGCGLCERPRDQGSLARQAKERGMLYGDGG